ncbi:microfibril-associated glycoprotein 4-like [Scomber scombrus]|uniref:Microfibril-associated glycoprotein 4-like n=1 Tax=Scomber scombrus TaxID=13677 RepID=A0AAV1QC23_SCOSC
MKLVSVFLLLLAPALTCCLQHVLPLDCNDIHNHDKSQPSGVYTIYPIGATSAVQVYCDMDSDEGGWTVFQRRMDGSVNFYRPWDQYKNGFGSAAVEYWLGDSMKHHNGQKFSTFDKDQDSSSSNCAKLYLGAFWYNECHRANPNGVYRWGADATVSAVGVSWSLWKGRNYSLKTISMKIRPVQ